MAVPRRIAPEILPPSAPADDGRELIRFSAGVENLPRDTFPPPTFLERYRWQISGLVLVCLLQMVLIGRLFLERLRRNQQEAIAKLISELSSRFIALPPDEVDREIEHAQRKVCESLGLEISALWQWSPGRADVIKMTHLYRPLGGPPIPEPFSGEDYFPWCVRLLQARKPVIVSSVDSVPAEAWRDKEVWRHFGIKSSLTFPLSTGVGEVFGALGFNTVTKERAWLEETIMRLQVVAQIFANALARRQADQALKESEARLNMAADSAGAGLWGLDLRTGQYWMTKKTRDVLHLEPGQDLTVDQFIELVHPEDRLSVRNVIQEVVNSGAEGAAEYRLRRPDGTYQWLASRGRVRPATAGKPDFLMGVTVDITSRKQGEEALRKAQMMVNAIIERTNDMIWSVDRETFGLLTFNRALIDFFSNSRKLAIRVGMRPEDLHSAPEHIETWRNFYLRVLESGPFTTEYGSTNEHVLLLNFNLVEQDGKVFGLSVFGKDITEWKKAEAEANELRSELAHAGRVTVLGQLASSLAHELSQPLGAILRNAEAAELILRMSSPDLEELRAIVADIRADDQRAGNVIDRLRSLLKRKTLDLQRIQIDDLIREVLSLVRTDATSRRVKLNYSGHAFLPPILGDRTHLQQVLLNLLVNGMDALSQAQPGSGVIEITARYLEPDLIEVRVLDNGSGILDHSPAQLFAPFFTTKPNGMGMGLAVTKTIIEAHQGRIWAENLHEGGACFGFTLPIAADREVSPPTRQSNAAYETTPM